MKTSPSLGRFQRDCHRYLACYTFANIGFVSGAEQLSVRNPNPEASLIIGTGHPDEGRRHGAVEIGPLIRDLRDEEGFADLLAKALLVAIYALWDEVYRPELAREEGVKVANVRSNLMGDLRKLRNCVVHGKSRVPSGGLQLSELGWTLEPGEFYVSQAMFQGFIDAVNGMTVQLEGPTEIAAT
jgi:hypothetical protein